MKMKFDRPIVFFDLETKIKAHMNLKKSLYHASYFDRSVQSFIDVGDIKDNVVILKNGTILGLIEVKPIDFFILGKEERERVLSAYQSWLKSIDYYVQILSRSVEVNLDKWVSNISRKAPKQNKESISSLSGWIKKETARNNLRNRLFYIIIPEKPEITKKPIMEDIKSIFTGNYGSPAESIDFERAKKNLKSNVVNCMETLGKCGVTTRRLKTNELLGLYSSYFTNQSKINKTVLSPIMELEPAALQEQDAYYRKVKA